VDATDPADCIDPPATAEVKADVSDDRGISASGICLMTDDPVSTNVLTNPSFEDGGGSLTGWNTSDVSWTMNGDWYMPAAPYDGSNYASIQCSWGSPGDSHELRQTVSVASNQPYFLSIYAQANSNDYTVYHSVRWYDGADPGSKGQCTEVDATTNTGGIWTQLSGVVVPTGSTMTVCYRAEASCVGQWGYGFHFDLFTLSPMTSADSYDGATATWNSVQFNTDQDHVKVVAVDDAGNSSAMADSYDVGWYYDGIEPECGAPDTTSPSPDPMTWSSVPAATSTTSIAMTATTATDPSGVEYYFTCTAGGGNDSGWQSSPTYEDTGLQPDTTYTYTVKARDQSANQNETAASSAESGTTDPPPDTAPPSPDPMTWASVPATTGTTSISMTATTASDPSGVEYYFTCIAGGGNDSGWQSSPTYEDTGLHPDTTYTYTVKARDLSPNQNETGVSSAESATTDQDSGWTVLTYDNFEGGFGNYTDGGGDCLLYTEGTHAHQGDNAADIRDNSGVSSSFYHTNSYDVTSYIQLRVTFWYKAVSMEAGEDFFLEYDDGGGWAIVEDWISGTDFSNDQFYNPTVFLDSGTYNFTATAQFRFRCDAGSNTDDIYIDEVAVAAIGDIDPPSPDPMTWVSVPAATGTTSIAMTATTASDPSGVEYYFTCTAGGGNNSGWQDSTSYTDTGLQPDTTYTYTAKARDKSANQNETAASSAQQATTDPLPSIGWAPASLAPTCQEGQDAVSQSFNVWNSGSGTLSYTITDGGTAWLTLNPTSGTSTGESDTITVTYSTSGLPAETYSATITISDPDAANNPQTIPVSLTVTEPLPPVVLVSAVSRKTHTGAGNWDIDVGAGDIESRSAQLGTANPNELLIIATFDVDIGLLGSGDEVVSTDVGTVASADQIDLRVVQITITDLPLNTQVNLTFTGVVEGGTLNPATACGSTLCVRVIVGDYDNLGRTNYTDFSKVKNAGSINQLVDSLDKARADFDCGGRPNYTDYSKVTNAGLINQTADACTTPIGP